MTLQKVCTASSQLYNQKEMEWGLQIDLNL